MEMIQNFEERFSSLDSKVLFEETKMDSYLARKKSGSYGGKKKLMKPGGRSAEDFNRPMSSEEKKNLSRAIRNLTATQLKGIISIVKDLFPEKNGMLEFDIDILPPHKCRELEGYVMRIKNEGRKPPRMAGIPNTAGLSRQKSGGPFAPKGHNIGTPGSLGSKVDEFGRQGGAGYGLMGKSGQFPGAVSNPSSDSESDSSNSSGKSDGV